MKGREGQTRWAIVSICVALFIVRQVKPDFFNAFQSIKLDAFSVILLAILGFTLIQPYLNSWLSYISSINKRWVLVTVCLALVIARLILPDTRVDTNSIWLMGIAALLFILPDLKSVAPYIKKIKFGDTELELKESIGNLGKEVEKAKDAVQEKEVIVSSNVSSEIEKVLEESSKDPKAALLLLSAKIERQLRNRLEEAGIPTGRSLTASRSVEIGVREGIFPQDFYPAFRDFQGVRNRVAHGEAFDVDDSYILSLISLGTELLQIASTTNKDDLQNDSNLSKKAE